MFKPVRKADSEAESPSPPSDQLVPLAELVIEGFGRSLSPYANPLDVLAAELGSEVWVDDIGRRCTSRAVARRLFTERAEAEEKRRQAERERLRNAPRRSVPRGKPVPEELMGANGEFPPAMAVLKFEETVAAGVARTNERLAAEREAAEHGVSAYRPIRDQEGA